METYRTLPDETLKKALKEAENTGKPLYEVLIDNRVLTEKDILNDYARYLKLSFVDLEDKQIPKSILQKLPEKIAKKYGVVVFDEESGFLKVATLDPLDFQTFQFIEKQLNYKVKVYIATARGINNVLDQYKGELSTEVTKVIQEESEEHKKEEIELESPEKMKEIIQEAPIAKAINIILEYAVKTRASDIHVEPREDYVHVRYRIDGILRDTMTLPKEILSSLISRIKIMANLRIDEHRIPQDGRIKVDVDGKKIAIRISTLPIMDGEKVVMRLLDESTKAATLEELGFKGMALEIVKRNLKRPHGMTLVTGPTGSGKSTTLYSILSGLNTIGVNISTVEDPVEYRISGVNQTQVNPKVGMTFATGLRALLRQDPDIIMVGEIRDNETAEMAVHSALTGHIVLSTLHTNNASGALPRLLDMGIEPFLIASTVNTVIAQRLVRRLCPYCKEEFSPSEEMIKDLKKEFNLSKSFLTFDKAEGERKEIPASATGFKERKIMPPKNDDSSGKQTPEDIDKFQGKKEEKKSAPSANSMNLLLYRGKGCNRCDGGGYLGRMGIYEVLEINDEIGDLIVKRASTEEIQDVAIRNGMLTMHQDGFIKALEGLTSLEEILRVTKE